MEAGEILRLPVFLESPMPVGACAFALGFDPDYFDVLSVEPSDFIPRWDEETLNHQALADGVVRVAWSSPGGSGIRLDQNQPFLYVVLQARKGVTSLRHFASLMPLLQDCSVVSPDLQVNNIELGFEDPLIDVWVHPNPASNYVMIQFELGRNVPLELEVFDSSGRLVWNKGWANYGPDVQNWVIPVSTWPEGIYVARIQSPWGSISSRFVIAR
ncbi:MAG: T9SS C-terminal target domain-containing protein [Methanobacteriota archaeon]|nr:MAG: T9SS C-terminal target domain-containing protein [Euryarchaeota archaeon]